MAGDTIKTNNKNESRTIPSDDDNVDEVASGAGSEKEIGGRDGPDPTRYGDWEKAGRCIDF